MATMVHTTKKGNFEKVERELFTQNGNVVAKGAQNKNGRDDKGEHGTFWINDGEHE